MDRRIQMVCSALVTDFQRAWDVVQLGQLVNLSGSRLRHLFKAEMDLTPAQYLSPQPYLSEGESKNGFRALAMLDSPEYGGNNDGQIDGRDNLFADLKLWQDRNHNGVSEVEELQSLPNSVVRVIELRYHESKRQDEHGNWFRYRAKVRDARGAQVGRWAWDVFLRTTKVSH